MCGIWGYFLKKKSNSFWIDDEDLFTKFKSISGRGPDNLNFNYYNDLFYLGFHRLSIMDTSVSGNQPFIHKTDEYTYICMCNGEIYNAEDIKKSVIAPTLNYPFESGSDCEVLIPLYMLYDFKMVDFLKGVFAFTIIKIDNDGNYQVFVCRDRIGVRPLFLGLNRENGSVGISSELKGLVDIFEKVTVFPPGSHLHFDNSSVPIEPYVEYYKYIDYVNIKKLEYTDIEHGVTKMINDTFTQAVKSRLISDRPVCALLSGGLDSSLVCSVSSRLLKEFGKKLYTFSIGMPGSTDEYYAKKVADFIESEHTVVNITMDEALGAIKDVIWATETFDITTIRASTGQYLIGKYISKNTDFKVVLSGDGSDEVASGYIYNYLAPSDEALHNEAVKRVKEIHLYDGLRADRATSIHGLELRVPFLDSDFVNSYLSIDPNYRMPDANHIEKYLLRCSFQGYLPEEVLWRKKEAFSDGISSEEDSWHKIIEKFVNDFVTDDEFNENSKKYKHCTPKTKEAYFYRKIFDELFGDKYSNVIPDIWMPNWSDSADPSARELGVLYKIKPVNYLDDE